MRFDELPLYEAIYAVRREIENPGSDDWPLKRREELCRAAHLPIGSPLTMEQMLDAWVRYRKSADNKIELAVQVARSSGGQCFYQNRGKGKCSEDVAIDRIIPGSRGGQYTVENCFLACTYHNCQRGDRSLEDYLRPPETIGSLEA